jgi:hypothetical protein
VPTAWSSGTWYPLALRYGAIGSGSPVRKARIVAVVAPIRSVPVYARGRMHVRTHD